MSSPVTKLFVSISGIYFCFIVSSVYLEKLLPSSKDKSKTDPTVAIMVMQNFFAALVAFVIRQLIYDKPNPQTYTNRIQNGLFNSISVFAATKGSIYLSFPALNLIKASKSLSILFIALLIGKNSYKSREIINVLLIFSGIVIYNMTGSVQESTGSTWVGWGLAAASLIADGFFGESQRVSTNEQGAQLYDLMETTNFWAGLFALIFGVCNGDLIRSSYYFVDNTNCILDLLLCVSTGALGQIFIHYTISHFSPLFLSIVTTSRKFFSIFLSIILFGHHLHTQQVIGLFLVLFGVIYEIYEKSKGGDKKITGKEKCS